MFHVFRHVPAQAESRFGAGSDARLDPYTSLTDEAQLEALVLPEGENYVVYQEKGRADDDGIPPRLELVRKLRGRPQKPQAADVVESF